MKMSWLIWKQQRKQFTLLSVIATLYAGLAIPTGIHFWRVYQQALTTCNPADTCKELGRNILQSSWDLNINPSLQAGGFNLVILFILLMPFLMGMFIGVPLIAKEYNAGTNLLIWTRSVSRRRWLTMKLLWTLAATALFAGIFAALTTWWSGTGNVLHLDRFDTVKFGLQGLAPVAYAVFAVSLGIALGTWLKRTMLAIGLTLMLLLTTQIIVSTLVRPHYMTPLVQTLTIQQNKTPGGGLELSPQVPLNSGAAWIVGGGLVSKNGQPLNWSSPPQECIVTGLDKQDVGGGGNHTAVRGNAAGQDPLNANLSQNGGPAVSLRCLDKLEYHWVTEYHPADRYWRFQQLEAGLYILLSLIPLGATYWLVLRRDA